MTPAPICPACGRTGPTFLGKNGCRAPVQDCHHPWHCRHPEHIAAAHTGVRLPFPQP